MVGFQTAYSALVEGDYEKCVANAYGSHANWPAVRVVDKLPDTGKPVDPVDPPVDGVAIWESNKVYTGGDKVSYQGAVYKAKWWTQSDIPTSGGPWALESGAPVTPEPVDPVEPPVDPVDPVIPVEPVEPVDPPAIDVPVWNAGAVYVGGDKVSYQGSEYKAKWWTKGNKPDSGSPWQKL